MNRNAIEPLPKWVLTDLQPAFYDIESVTAVKMVAKLYGKMEQLIDDYNYFVDKVNQNIEQFEDGMIHDFDCFKDCIKKLIEDYIDSIDMIIANQNRNITESITAQNQAITEKFLEQDHKIDDAVNYMKTNLLATCTELFSNAVHNGDITATLLETYDSTNESLVLSIVAEESEGE